MKSVFCLLLAIVCASCAFKDTGDQYLKRYEYHNPEMGSPFRIVLYAYNQLAADAAAKAAFQRIAQLNDIMTDYDTDSELNRLSQTSGSGKEIHVSDDLWTVLDRAQELAQRSGGAFDVTVGAYVGLWRKARREGVLPDPARLARAREAVGFARMRLHPERHTVELLVPNMQLDLGGIAKGYAV